MFAKARGEIKVTFIPSFCLNYNLFFSENKKLAIFLGIFIFLTQSNKSRCLQLISHLLGFLVSGRRQVYWKQEKRFQMGVMKAFPWNLGWWIISSPPNLLEEGEERCICWEKPGVQQPFCFFLDFHLYKYIPKV